MSIAKRLVTTAAGILLFVSIVCAQEQNVASSSRSAITITAASTPDQVRFTAPSTVVQMRLEVYAANGEKLFDNEIRGGNVIDWHLQDGQAERVSDGSYLCVITSKGLSGRMSQKLGKITIENAAARVEPIGTTQLTAQQTQAVGPLEENASLTVLKEGETQTATVIAHNGEEGQITRGRGALSFRIGDFFSGKDTEQMRLTPEGNLGIGITHPKVRLDVDGLIRTSQGIVFSDGTIQTTAAASASRGEVAPRDIGAGARKLFKETNQGASSGKDGKGKKQVKPELVVNEDLTINGNIIFTPALARDMTMQQNIGGIRIFAGTTLTAVAPTSAAIQFFGNGHGGFPGQAYIDSGAHDQAAVIFRTTGTGGTITERMRVTATGNVGIGTTSPANKLHIHGGGLTFSDPGGFANQNRFAWSDTPTSTGVLTLDARDDANGFVRPLLAVQHTGNVGIGTTAPTQLLHLSRGGAGSSTDVQLDNTDTGGGSWSISSVGNIAERVGNFEIKRPGISNPFQITPGGFVGIGTTSPTNRLHIRTTPDIGEGITLSDGVKTLRAGFQPGNGFQFGTNTNQDLILGAGGFDVLFISAGEGAVFPSSDNGQSLGNSTHRWSAVWSGNGTIQTSDARLKKTVTNLGYGLNQVMQLRPVSFQWKDRNDGRTHLGLIAQEVESVIPEAVERDKDPATPLGMNYTTLVPVVVKAIQEQQITLNTLKAENAALNARLAGLEKTADKGLALVRQRHSRLRGVKHVVSTGNSTPSRSRAGSGLAAQN